MPTPQNAPGGAAAGNAGVGPQSGSGENQNKKFTEMTPEEQAAHVSALEQEKATLEQRYAASSTEGKTLSAKAKALEEQLATANTEIEKFKTVMTGKESGKSDEDPTTQEYWINKIREEAAAVNKPIVEKVTLLEKANDEAAKSIVKKEGIDVSVDEAVLARAKTLGLDTALSVEQRVGIYRQAYASEHYDELLKKRNEADRLRASIDQGNLDAFSDMGISGAGTGSEVTELTSSERRIFSETRKRFPEMTPKQFKERLQESSSMEVLST